MNMSDGGVVTGFNFEEDEEGNQQKMAAESAGVRPGYRISALNGRQVNSKAEIVRAIQAAGGQRLNFSFAVKSSSAASSISFGAPGDLATMEGLSFDGIASWQHSAFADAFVDPFMGGAVQGRVAREQQAGFGNLIKALDFVMRALNATFSGQVGSSAESVVLRAFEDCFALAGAVPVNAEDPEAFYAFLSTLMTKINQMRPGEVLIIPGGWSRGDDGHVVLYVLSRYADKAGYSFGVVNTGEGIEYHSARVAVGASEILRNLPMVIEGVDEAKIRDSAFWMFLFRPQVYPHKHNGPKQLYTQLLPFLTNRPVSANIGDAASARAANWAAAPRGGDGSLVQSVLLALGHALRGAGSSRLQAEHSVVLLRSKVLHMIESDLLQIHGLTGSEAVLIELAARNIAWIAAEHARQNNSPISPPQLKDITRCMLAVQARVAQLRSHAMHMPPRLRCVQYCMLACSSRSLACSSRFGLLCLLTCAHTVAPQPRDRAV